MNDWRYIANGLYDGNIKKMLQHMEESKKDSDKKGNIKLSKRLERDIVEVKLIIENERLLQCQKTN